MEMRVEWEEMFGHLWCIMLYSWEYALITSICSWHMQHPVRYYLYYSVPWYSWHRDRVHVHTWHTAARDLWEDCYIVTTMNTYWNYHALRLFRYLCFMCLYVFVCVQPAVLGGGVGYILYSVFNVQPDSIYLYADILFLLWLSGAINKDTQEIYR
jgi:hypothetical protein